jgi:hypothetical protein
VDTIPRPEAAGDAAHRLVDGARNDVGEAFAEAEGLSRDGDEAGARDPTEERQAEGEKCLRRQGMAECGNLSFRVDVHLADLSRSAIGPGIHKNHPFGPRQVFRELRGELVQRQDCDLSGEGPRLQLFGGYPGEAIVLPKRVAVGEDEIQRVLVSP